MEQQPTFFERDLQKNGDQKVKEYFQRLLFSKKQSNEIKIQPLPFEEQTNIKEKNLQRCHLEEKNKFYGRFGEHTRFWNLFHPTFQPNKISNESLDFSSFTTWDWLFFCERLSGGRYQHHVDHLDVLYKSFPKKWVLKACQKRTILIGGNPPKHRQSSILSSLFWFFLVRKNEGKLTEANKYYDTAKYLISLGASLIVDQYDDYPFANDEKQEKQIISEYHTIMKQISFKNIYHVSNIQFVKENSGKKIIRITYKKK